MSDNDKVEKLREYIRRHCDLINEISDLKERMTEKNKLKAEMEFKILPDLFNDAGVTSLGLPAQGNEPAYEAKLTDFFKANIRADWSDAEREAGFQVLEDLNCADMIRHVIELELPAGSGSEILYKKVISTLEKLDVTKYMSVDKRVPWNTLTSFLKERYRKNKPLGDKQLRLIGATISSIVRITAKR